MNRQNNMKDNVMHVLSPTHHVSDLSFILYGTFYILYATWNITKRISVSIASLSLIFTIILFKKYRESFDINSMV